MGTEPTLAGLQEEVAALGRQVDALSGSIETAVRAAVAEEVQRVAGELQHTVAALGRVLVRDLGRLNQILTQHRDAILAELQSSPRPAITRAAESPPAPASPPAETGDPEDTADPTSESESADEKGRTWRRRKA